MHKLQLRGQLLYLNGNKQSLAKADAHNNRMIPIELGAFGHINPDKVALNQQIVSLHNESLESKVLSLIRGAGIDVSKGAYKRQDKGLAIEWMFTVTPGFNCNFSDLYIDCLHWLKNVFPECPVAHAVIHFDEDDPHLHVIMVPIKEGKMPASRILGFKGSSRSRENDIYEQVGKKYGLSYPLNLKGAVKRYASDVAIGACEKLPYRNVLTPLWKPLVMAIKSRPEPFLEALGIGVDLRNQQS